MNFEVLPGLVSTIIPVFNRPAMLAEAVASVLAQDYRPIEVIIVDDGSSDVETIRVARDLESDNPGIVRAISQDNAGPGAARERGRSIARGEFIQYLDCDDLLLPGKFAVQVAALKDQPKADVAYGITYFWDAAGKLHEVPHKDTGIRIGSMFPKFLNGRWWDTATPLYRASVCAKAGPWTNLRLEEDWEYDCRVASLGGRLVWVPLPVCITRDHGGDRLSRGAALDSRRLSYRSAAHELVMGHAARFGLGPADPEMQVFSRTLFLLARQCGAAGLAVESQRLFGLARKAAGDSRSRGGDFRMYAILAAIFGWSAMGRLSVFIDRVRKFR